MNLLAHRASQPDAQLDSLAQSSLANEIHCYSLPYGALGFASHVLTYYTILCLWFGRKPLWPLSRVHFSRWDLILGSLGLLVTTVLSIVTIVRCRNTWQLLVIAVWKLDVSLLNGITAIHVAVLIRRQAAAAVVGRTGVGVGGSNSFGDGKADPAREKVDLTPVRNIPPREEQQEVAPIHVLPLKSASWWILLYIPGMVAGFIGLMSLVHKSHGHAGVPRITAGFYVIVGAGILTYLIGTAYNTCGPPKFSPAARRIALGGLIWGVAAFGILAVFYSDWALGMMTGNITGLPSGDSSALYWSYFVGKRLPMLSL